MADRLDIAVRAWTDAGQAEQHTPRQLKRQGKRFPDNVLIFDTETTTDAAQALTFGGWRYCRVCESADGVVELRCVAEGLFHADDLASTDPAAYATLERYVGEVRADVDRREEDAEPELSLMSLTDWSERVLYKAGYRLRAAIVCFNAPFDLSRIAWDVGYTRTSRNADHDPFVGGFSFEVFSRPTKTKDGDRVASRHRPRVAIKSLDSKRALKGFRSSEKVDGIDQIPDASDGRPNPSYRFRGHLLDLRTFAFALTDRGHSLESACNAFDVPYKKRDVQHGRVDRDYITYGREDVAATQDLCAAALTAFLKHPIDLQATRAYSPASIGRGYLTAMGIQPPRDRQDFDPKMLGAAMSAYYGGRAETHIRRTPVPVVYCDFLSMYPTVCCLTGLWSLLTAERIETVDATDDVRKFLTAVTQDDLYKPERWKDFVGIAQILPDQDIVPVRARYGAGPSYQIGVNHLTSDEPMWFTIPDLIASTLLTGRPPNVLRAVRYDAHGTQAGLRPVDLLRTARVDPTDGDFFKTVIEQRKLAQQAGHDDLAKGLKTLANSTSYGIYAQHTRRKLSGNSTQPVTVYGYRDDPHTHRVNTPEDPGPFAFPPIAAVITGGARLLLAMAEHAVTQRGGSYAFCDTDSIAIVATQTGGPVDGVPDITALSWETVEGVRGRFAALNPYDPAIVSESLLELETENYAGDDRETPRQQLWCCSISAKRYALYTRDAEGIPQMVKASQHGLGHLLNPTDPDSEKRDWIDQVWDAIVREAHGLPVAEPTWLDRLAVSQISITSPDVHRLLTSHNEDRSYAEQINPFGFLRLAYVSPIERPADDQTMVLVAPYERDPREWTRGDWINRFSGRTYRVSPAPSMGAERAGLVTARTMRPVLAEYATHPEQKSGDSVGNACTRGTSGLLSRRRLEARTTVHIGKEANRLEEAAQGLERDADARLYDDHDRILFSRETLPALRALGVREVARRTGHSLGAVHAVLAGEAVPRPAAHHRYEGALRPQNSPQK